MITETKMIADSLIDSARVTTFEVKVPLAAWVQILTHRQLSRNAASNRAIPTAKLVELFGDFVPQTWRKNDRGMSPSDYLSDQQAREADKIWRETMKVCREASLKLSEIGLHKEQANRLISPFLWVKGLLTATDWKNFIDLRTHESTQEETREVASSIQKFFEENKTDKVQRVQAHIPFVKAGEQFKSMMDAFCISAARCARVSYDAHDGNSSPQKDIELALRLIQDGHMSPLEHVAIAQTHVYYLQHHKALSFVPRNVEDLYGNFSGVIQFRKLLEFPVNAASVINSLRGSYEV